MLNAGFPANYQRLNGSTPDFGKQTIFKDKKE
jgi:hypothetical protein